MRASLLLALGAALLLAAPRPASAQKVVRDYEFPETLKDGSGRGPDLEALNGAVGFKKYSFAVGNGLRLPKAGVTDHYTLEIHFQFDKNDNWQKVVDFKNRGSDNGLYVYNGQLQFYNLGIGGEFQVGKEYRVRLERDRDTKAVRGFVGDDKAFEFIDTAGDAIFENETAFFFVDDEATTEEQASGQATRIRIWDAPGGK